MGLEHFQAKWETWRLGGCDHTSRKAFTMSQDEWNTPLGKGHRGMAHNQSRVSRFIIVTV
jgi:hypothetical protein